jgi:hypothetical protein
MYESQAFFVCSMMTFCFFYVVTDLEFDSFNYLFSYCSIIPEVEFGPHHFVSCAPLKTGPFILFLSNLPFLGLSYVSFPSI